VSRPFAVGITRRLGWHRDWSGWCEEKEKKKEKEENKKRKKKKTKKKKEKK
jgi:hypothetical protein